LKMRLPAVLALISVAIAKSNGNGARKSVAFLASDLHPQVVAENLAVVEDEWRAEAASFVACGAGSNSSDCGAARSAFQRSCSTVLDAVVKASNGDRHRVQEYMGIVCDQAALHGWHKDGCDELALSLVGAMIYDANGNREYLDTSKACGGFWANFSAGERLRLDQEERERAAFEKTLEDERVAMESKAEEQRVEAEKKAAAVLEEDRQRQEQEERATAAEEAKRKAEEAAEARRLEKEEAARQAEEAKQRAEEARLKLEKAQAAAEEEAARQAEEAKQRAEEARMKLEKAQAAAEAATRAHHELLAKANLSNGSNITKILAVPNATNGTNTSTNTTSVNVSK